MKRTIWLQETKRMRFTEAYGDWQQNRLTQEEAALILGVPRTSGCKAITTSSSPGQPVRARAISPVPWRMTILLEKSS